MTDVTSATGVPPAIFEPGKEIGVSGWIVVDQDMITKFGEVTCDPDPMHMDAGWAAEHGPYGGTIAFGFLTMSLLTTLLYSATGFYPGRVRESSGSYVNYGFDRLRLIAPVPVGARIRGRFDTLDSQRDAKGHERVKIGALVEIEGADRPALSAEWLTVWINHDTSSRG